MDLAALLPFLTFGTMFAVVIFAMISQARTERRRKDPNAPHSSLARRTPDPNLQPDMTQTRKDIFTDR